ncbi:MAG: thiamine pyrophosphate-dependent enzyme [Candidatus Nanopelagicales bacterium]
MARLSDSQTASRRTRAEAIAEHDGFEAALEAGALPTRLDLTLAEALVLGLLRQDVRKFITVFGHGSTALADVLRTYSAAGVVQVFAVRHETEAAHAATALRWVTGEKAAVVTSIGPGALQAMAGSLVASSDGVGVWHIYGDETTQDEGPNMQQIPRAEQGLFLRLASTMGPAYTMHTPAALPTALRRGLIAVDHPHRPGPFFLLLPLNTQPAILVDFNLRELPVGAPPRMGVAATGYEQVADVLLAATRVVIKVGGGATGCGESLARLAELVDGVFVTSPVSTGIVPSSHPRQLTVGGSKGSLSGNFAMEHADTLLVVGSRAVCQSDSSRTGYPLVQHVVNINTDVDAAMHYSDTTALVGDAGPTLDRLIEVISERAVTPNPQPSTWLRMCQSQRADWEAFKSARLTHPTLRDDVWGREVLTQPAAIHTVLALAHARAAVTFFDAGDVQANGFQIAADEAEGLTITDGGASYMGFATSAVLASGLSDTEWQAVALTGDGSFTMNPQVLIDGVEHGANAVIVIFDNRRMAAISSLQQDQYGVDFATNDSVVVDYVGWAGAVSGVLALSGGYTIDSLSEAVTAGLDYEGLAVVHVPVYFGPDELGGLGAYGNWNVGNWVDDTQRLRHDIGL